jgi:N-acetylglucosamine kinase-like BadF-type ATPase
MDVVVAVDGGGTKTDVAVLDLDGQVLARSRAGAFLPQFIGPAASVEQLDKVAAGLLDELGHPRVVGGGVYFSGLDFPFEVDAFRAELERRPWASPRLLVDNDTFALLRAGTDEPTAVAIICGTGMNCVGRSADGRVVRFAAIGSLSGDWGGGGSLGRDAIWHAARAADGRGPATALEALTCAALGRTSMADVIIGFHIGELNQDRISELAPLVFEAAAGGDEVAAGVIQRLADEITAFAVATLKRLGVLGQPCPVLLGGGIIAARHESLLRAVDVGLAERAPGAYTVIISEPPILGAALLAFDALGAGTDVSAQVRASLR